MVFIRFLKTCPALLEELRSRKDTWLKKEQETRTLESTISAIKGEIQRLNGILETQETALQAKQATLKDLMSTYSSGKEERQKLFGDKDADTEETRLSDALHTAETAEKIALKNRSDLAQKVSAAKTRIESLQTSLAKREPLLETQTSLFLEELTCIGFSDEQQFLSVRLPLIERNRLASAAKALEERQTALKTTMHDRRSRLELEQARKLTDKTLLELPTLGRGYTREGERPEGCDCGNHRAKLKGNGEAKQRIENKLEGIERQRKECSKWERLHSLIGSADEKRSLETLPRALPLS